MYDRSVTEHQPLRVLLYSDDRDVRAAVIAALGTRPHPDLPPITFVECATEPVVWQHLDARGADRIDLAVLDGEATPVGGMGIAKQMKDEIFRAPPALLITGRPQDAWLATWSRADAVVSHPIEPIRLAEVVISMMRGILQTA